MWFLDLMTASPYGSMSRDDGHADCDGTVLDQHAG